MDRTRVTPTLRVTVGITTLLLLVASLPPDTGRTLHAQQKSQIFFSAYDSVGNPVSMLTPDDVTVTEDDVACKTVKVDPIDWPMKLTVLVDNGHGSTAWLANLRTGLQGFFDAIPAGVEASILTIGSQPRWVVRPTMDKAALSKGITLIAQDAGAPMFVDALLEASKRIDTDKSEHFPVIVLITSDVGGARGTVERDLEQIQKLVQKHAVTVHFVLATSGSQSQNGVTGALQTDVGISLTKMSGGRYESINSGSRLASLLPELGKQIATSNDRQTHQYRITYERPAKATKPPQGVGINLKRPGVSGILSFDGHIPAP